MHETYFGIRRDLAAQALSSVATPQGAGTGLAVGSFG
jgi:hypothetical protein